MPELFALSGPDLGSSKAFEHEIVLGRIKECDWVLKAPSVSRRHARVEVRDGKWFAVDLDSSNGLHFAGERVPEVALTDGALFQVGDVELRFRLARGKDSSKPAVRKAGPAPTPAPKAPQPKIEIQGMEMPTPPAEGGIELEGDWSDDPPPAPPVAAVQPNAPSERAGSKTASKRRRPARDDARTRAQAAAVGGLAGERRTAAGGKVLQFSRVEQREGLLAADLGQQPAWLRTLLILLLAALAIGLAWGAFELSRSLRSDEPSMEIDESL